MSAYIKMGMWPQSPAKKGVTFSAQKNGNGYYTGSDGKRYGRIITYQNEELYFKVEPITWRILKQTDGIAFLLSKYILASNVFGWGGNNYQTGELRAWLYNAFYSAAFSQEEKSRILVTEVDNGARSAMFGDLSRPAVCPNTSDKVFLLSAEEAFEKFGLKNKDRKVRPTAYCKASGLRMDDNFADENGCGWWWLRSPMEYSEEMVLQVANDGNMTWWVCWEDVCGVVPAMRVKLK